MGLILVSFIVLLMTSSKLVWIFKNTWFLSSLSLKEKDQTDNAHSADLRNVFGDSDDEEEEAVDYAVQNEIEHDFHVSIHWHSFISDFL